MYTNSSTTTSRAVLVFTYATNILVVLQYLRANYNNVVYYVSIFVLFTYLLIYNI
jgi:hypothetical protein